MLRDPHLIPLSRQHHNALALCVRIQRRLLSDLKTAQSAIERLFQEEIDRHFEAEERVLFPAAARFDALSSLVDELISEHKLLRKYAAQAAAAAMSDSDLQNFADTLSCHVRKEERQLFEPLQTLMPADEMERVGVAVDEYLRKGEMPGASCALRPPKNETV